MAMQVKRLAEGTETWKPLALQSDGRKGWDEYSLDGDTLRGYCSEAEIPYLVLSPSSKSDAINGVITSAPPYYKGIPISSVRFDSYEGENIRCTAVYQNSSSSSGNDDEDDDLDEEGNERIYKQVSVSTATMHTTIALSQRCVGVVPYEYQRYIGTRIGWNGKTDRNCEYAGVDVPIGQTQVVYYGRLRNERLTNAYLMRVGSLAGKINNKEWKGWPAQSMLFIGANIPKSNAKRTNCTFTFQLQQPEKKYVDGYFVSKAGWDYVWGLPQLGIPPIVSKVIPTADFSEIGI